VAGAPARRGTVVLLAGPGELLGSYIGPAAKATEAYLREELDVSYRKISRFFAAQPHERAVQGAAEHIAKFWDPRMRAHIRAHLEAGGQGLEPIAREAVASLQK